MPHLTEIERAKQTFTEFVSLHKPQLDASGIPERYWHTLYEKLTYEIFDAGSVFSILQVQECSDEEEEETDINYSWQVAVSLEDGITTDDPKHIYLIDHAWTFRVDQAKKQLRELESLRTRMATLMDIDMDEKTQDEVVESVFNSMWRYNQTYSLGNMPLGSDQRVPIWYIMDEFGSRIQHSDDPSCRVIPFFYTTTQTAFSLLWPVKDLAAEDEVTRNFIEDEGDAEVRKCRLLPWKPAIMTHVTFQQEEPLESFFKTFRREECLPVEGSAAPNLPTDRSIRVYCEHDQIPQFLTDGRFEHVEDELQADVVWGYNRSFDFSELSKSRPNQLVNVFPHECVLTVKDLLAVIARRAGTVPREAGDLDSSPVWLPITYNLLTELPHFVSYFQHRAAKGEDNIWLCKPWNLARGLDTHITNNLDYILRLPESGPKVACKYISDPVLFYREEISAHVKFDLRFHLLLESVSPLSAYVDKRFFIRFANKQFDLHDLDDYQKHFTVMNYVAGADMKEMYYNDFIKELEQQNPSISWHEIQEKIQVMLRCLLEAATAYPPPRGIGHCPQSRTFYGVDIMLAWQTFSDGEKIVQPMLIEVNRGPDLTRRCSLFPDLLNQIFSRLFLKDESCSDFIPL